MNQIKFSGHSGVDFRKNLRLLARLQKPLTTKAIQSQKFENFLASSKFGSMYYGNHQGQILVEVKA